jgi:hypothetical protein
MSNKSAACKFITAKTTVIPKPGKFPDVDNKSVKSDTSGTDNIEDQKYQDKQAMPYDPPEPTDWDPPVFETRQEEYEAREDGTYAEKMRESRADRAKAWGLDADHNKEWEDWDNNPNVKWVEDEEEKDDRGDPYPSEEKDAAALMQEAIKQAAKPGDLNYAPLGPPKAQQDPNWQPPGYRNPNLNKKFRDAQTPSKKPTNNNPTGNVNAAINSNKPLTAASWRKNSSAAELTRKAIKQAASFTQYINPFNWGGNIGKSNDLDKKLKDAKKTTTPTKNLNQQLDAQKRPINAASWRKNI